MIYLTVCNVYFTKSFSLYTAYLISPRNWRIEIRLGAQGSDPFKDIQARMQITRTSQLFAPLRLRPCSSKWHLTNIRYGVRSDYVCSAARHLKLTAHLLQPLRRILASWTDISWWLAEIKEHLFKHSTVSLVYAPSFSTSSLFSWSVSFYSLQSIAGWCCWLFFLCSPQNGWW